MMQNWLSRWRLRRIIAALTFATDYGLRKNVVDFAQSLEATILMSRGQKKDAPLTIQATYAEINEFVNYMTRLHSSKLSLWHRARIGLATLALADKHVLGEDPEEFVKREFGKAKSSKDDNKIQLINL